MIEPLRLSVDLDCAADHAFDVWTRRLSMWWPKDHSVSGDPETEIHLEPWVYGRIFERTPDGTEHDWGRINRWDPPSHLGYQWHIGRDADAATDVELTSLRSMRIAPAWRSFTPDGNGLAAKRRTGATRTRQAGGQRSGATEPQ